jgi:hypothetical protein
MATWTVEQKVEVWYSTTVEADTLEEAIKAADESSDWNIQPATREFCDEYWAMNEDTTDQYSVLNGLVIKE